MCMLILPERLVTHPSRHDREASPTHNDRRGTACISKSSRRPPPCVCPSWDTHHVPSERLLTAGVGREHLGEFFGGGRVPCEDDHRSSRVDGIGRSDL